MSVRRLLRTATLLCPLLYIACSDSSGPGDGSGGRPSGTTEPTLSNIWPDEDGNDWSFATRIEFTREPAETRIFATREEVPEMPDLDVIEALLPEFERDDSFSGPGDYTLWFNGEHTTDSGAVGKNLEERYGVDLERNMLPSSASLYYALLQHRPDLRSQIEAVVPELSSTKGVPLFNPILVRGGAWTRTRDFIAFYNDLDMAPHFRLLEDNFEPGHEWSTQLLPSIGAGAWLHARVLGPVSLKLPSRTGPQTIRVLYAFDMGIQGVRDPDGSLQGFTRSIAYGVVDYTTELGPVHFHEFHAIYLDKDRSGEVFLRPPLSQYEGWTTD